MLQSIDLATNWKCIKMEFSMLKNFTKQMSMLLLILCTCLLDIYYDFRCHFRMIMLEWPEILATFFLPLCKCYRCRDRKCYFDLQISLNKVSYVNSSQNFHCRADYNASSIHFQIYSVYIIRYYRNEIGIKLFEIFS